MYVRIYLKQTNSVYTDKPIYSLLKLMQRQGLRDISEIKL